MSIHFSKRSATLAMLDCLQEQGLPTRDQEAHATFSGRLLTCGRRAFEQSKRVRVVSMATRMRSSRSATARRARP